MSEVTRIVLLRDGTRADHMSVERTLQSVRTLRQENFPLFLEFILKCRRPETNVSMGLARLRELDLIERNGGIRDRVRRIALSAVRKNFNYSIESPYLRASP